MCEEHRMMVQYNHVRFPNASDGQICPAGVILAKRKASLYKIPQNQELYRPLYLALLLTYKYKSHFYSLTKSKSSKNL